jgi:hypothetical protein
LLLGAATRCRDAIGISVWGSQLERRVRLIARVRDQLGPAEHDAAFREGMMLSYADAVAAMSDL